jgi:hypothetical protein
MVICWLGIVNTARSVTWYRGLIAGWLASILAYPLSAGIFVGFGLLTRRIIGNPLDPHIGIVLLAPLFSLVLLPAFGIFTSIIGIMLGSLFGWLQGRDEARLLQPSLPEHYRRTENPW